MSNQRTNTKWAVALLALVAAMGMLAEGEAEDAERDVLVYCEGVAVFEAEKARGVPLENRTGHYDWDDSIDVAEQCPGMRPAAPALKSRERIVYSYPDYAQPPVQLVQF
ncbi:hypothetical protein [Vreelandella venusta]|uniref:Uncharacterized protein n=1 Tax=Vreelandella venusta TaxID=44935 RepID=A0AAP9ZG36_9GAMM|nr:hypothetical protein [Halomonas venusta]QRL05161.1 hypothetical protein JDS37_09610 [Halomonas venusta]GEK50931.1 hypothetical protein HVE01_16520 [Halomonas venusta]